MISPFLLEPQQQKGIQFCSFSKCIAKAYLLCHRSNPRFCSLCFDGSSNVKLMKAIYSFKTKSSFWIWATSKCSALRRLLSIAATVSTCISQQSQQQQCSFLFPASSTFNGCFYGSASSSFEKRAKDTSYRQHSVQDRHTFEILQK